MGIYIGYLVQFLLFVYFLLESETVKHFMMLVIQTQSSITAYAAEADKKKGAGSHATLVILEDQ